MREPGPEVMARFVGAENVEPGRAYLERLDPELHRYIMDFVYGEVYAGDVLDPKTRALCTVAMLACLDQQLQLGVYVRAARRQGASEDEVREVLRQVAVYAGFPSAWNALATMKASLERLRRRGHRTMSFTLDLTQEQHELRAKAHAFARDVIRPAAPEYDRAQEFPWPVVEEAARQGLYQWELYAQLSMDPTGLSLPILMEELFWGCAGIGLSIVMPALALAAIRQAATDEQLVRWAPECFGTPEDLRLAALAVTEPSGGSDVRSIQTRARKDGDDWVIDGQKVFIGNGGIADVHVVVATVDPDAGHRGQGVFIVPKRTPGLTLLRKLDKLGCRASHTGEIVFEDCRVPPTSSSAARSAWRGGSRRDARPSGAPRRRSPSPRRAAPLRRCSGAARRRLVPSSARARWWPRRPSGSRGRRWSSRGTTPSRARPSGSRSSRTRASPSRWPTSPPTSTRRAC